MEILLSVMIFVGVGAAFVFVNLRRGSLARPKLPNTVKSAIYECGEPTIGSSWVQFDLRFYTVALVFLIFDVEVALFYPWAVAYGSAAGNGRTPWDDRGRAAVGGVVDMLVFFGILMVGFAYLWRFGYLDWVRSTAGTSLNVEHPSGGDLSREWRSIPRLERYMNRASMQPGRGPVIEVASLCCIAWFKRSHATPSSPKTKSPARCIWGIGPWRPISPAP